MNVITRLYCSSDTIPQIVCGLEYLPHAMRSVKRGIVIVHVRLSVCLFVCLISKRVSGSSYTVENASNAALIPTSPEMKPELAAVGSATVAILSQSSGIATIFPMRRGHVVYNNCTLYLLL